MHEEAIAKLRQIFSENGAIRVITHLDTDGLTSATILINALKKFNQSFWLTTVKQLEDDMLDRLLKDAGKQKWKAIFFLDLGSSKLRKIKEFSNYLPLFVIDHHELDPLYGLEKADDKGKNENFFLADTSQYNNEEMSASCLTYLFVKKLDKSNKPLSQLAILGLIGDILDKNIGKNVQTIIEDAKDSGMQVKRGLTVFSAMRPIHKALEFSSNIFIPGVTGNTNGAIIMLRDLGIDMRNAKGYRTLLDLNKEELSRLITTILLRRVNYDNQEIINNIYLIKVSNHIWDAREISTMINACGRLNYSSLAIAFLMGSKKARDKIEDVYTKYKHHIIQSLNTVNNIDKIIGEKYVIINAKKMIKDTMIGTIVSILTSSFLYKEGTIIVGMAYRKDRKIKISARVVRGRKGYNSDNGDNSEGGDIDVNLEHVLRSVISVIGGEVGGHMNAAGCLISRKKESEFIELLKRSMDTEQIRIVA